MFVSKHFLLASALVGSMAVCAGKDTSTQAQLGERSFGDPRIMSLCGQYRNTDTVVGKDLQTERNKRGADVRHLQTK